MILIQLILVVLLNYISALEVPIPLIASLKQAPVILHNITDIPDIPVDLESKWIQVTQFEPSTPDGGNDDNKPILQPRDENILDVKQAQRGCSNVRYTARVSGTQFRIVSPSWPYNYRSNQSCSYFFSAPTSTQFTFICDINIACTPKDYIFWSLSGSEKFEDRQEYCGGKNIGKISEGNKLSIGFHSEPGRRPSGYRYRYSCRIEVIDADEPETPTTTIAPPNVSTTAPIVPPSQTTPTPTNDKCSCGIRNLNATTRIVGGTVTEAHSLPWRVTVFIHDQSRHGSICGGTIISPRYIMTAAHCTMSYRAGLTISVYTEAQRNPVTVGGGKRFIAQAYVQHPDFNKQNLDNDIAIIYLATPLTFSSKVASACLPFGDLATSDHAGINVLASGWGTTQPVAVNNGANNHKVSNTLLEVELPVLTTNECRQYQPLTDNQFCTYLAGKDTCQGDSGGSIDYKHTNERYYSIGITSFGYGCAQKNYPGVYSKVNNYLSWIQTKTKETFCQP